jgi:hypothetical protein
MKPEFVFYLLMLVFFLASEGSKESPGLTLLNFGAFASVGTTVMIGVCLFS